MGGGREYVGREQKEQQNKGQGYLGKKGRKFERWNSSWEYEGWEYEGQGTKDRNMKEGVTVFGTEGTEV